MATKSTGNNVTFGISMRPEMAREVKARAYELDIPVSMYLRELVIREMESGSGKPFKISKAALQPPLPPELDLAALEQIPKRKTKRRKK